ncbi:MULTISPECIES: small membrane protein YniD [Pantoea]|nr:small membrane protein YniD [Pantoea sp. UBA5923]
MAKYLPTKNAWKMVLVLLCICGALLLIRWAAMIWG